MLFNVSKISEQKTTHSNCFTFFEYGSLNAALGIAAASFFVLKGKKDRADSPTARERPKNCVGICLDMVSKKICEVVLFVNFRAILYSLTTNTKNR